MIKLEKKDAGLLFRLLNIWLFFVLVMWILSNLPHWGLTLFQAANFAVYFLLFLLTIAIIQRDPYNRDIFLGLALFFFILSVSIIRVIIGPGLLFGDIVLSIRIDHYTKVISALTFEFAILYIVVKYLLPNKKPWIRYLLALAIFLPVVWINFRPHIINPNYVMEFRSITAYMEDQAMRILRNHGFAFIYIITYAIYLYRSDNVLGVYINLLMASLFVFLSVQMVDLYLLNDTVDVLSNIILFINLSGLAIILTKKFLFNCSEYGQFYESLIKNKFRMGKVEIQQYRRESNHRLFHALKLYIAQRRVFLIGLLILFIASSIYIKVPVYLILIAVVFLLSISILILYVDALYRKREKASTGA